MGEFLVTRYGKPILFGTSLLGATWADREVVFNRPIEKIGNGLVLHWNGKPISEDKAHIVKVVAHWKKTLNRRARKAGVGIESVMLFGDFEEVD